MKSDTVMAWTALANQPVHHLFAVPAPLAQAFSEVLALLHAKDDDVARGAAIRALAAGAPAGFIREEAAIADNPRVFRALRAAMAPRDWWVPAPGEEEPETGEIPLLHRALAGRAPTWVIVEAITDGFPPVAPILRHPHRPDPSFAMGWPVDPGCRPLTAALAVGAFDVVELLWSLPGVATDQDTLDEALFWLASGAVSVKAAEWVCRLVEAGADPNRVVSVMPPWSRNHEESSASGADTAGRRWAHVVATSLSTQPLERVWKAIAPRLRPQDWPVLEADALDSALEGVHLRMVSGSCSALSAMDVLLQTKRPTTPQDTMGRALTAILTGALGQSTTPEQREALVGTLVETRPRPDQEVVRRALAASTQENGFWPLVWATKALGCTLSMEDAVWGFGQALSQAKGAGANTSWMKPPVAPKVSRVWCEYMTTEEGCQWAAFLDAANVITQDKPFDKATPEQLQALQMLVDTGAHPTRQPRRRRI